MSICEFCRHNVLESKKTWDYHHVNPGALHDPADSTCVFCTRLAALVKAAQPGHHKENKARYRWTLREAPQIREIKSHASITFRPAPDEQGQEEGTQLLPEVRFDVFPEDDLGYIPDEDTLGLGTDSDASINQMKSWLNHCENNHPNCKPRHASRDFMPSRVLDVGTHNDPFPPTHIRVVQTKDKNMKERYMTLSHCWGRKRFVQLTDETLKGFTKLGIPWAGDPHENDICSNKNFAEAIVVARKLGVRYIWIDSVCIIQNQPDQADWKAEAGLMHKVYRNSYCNLAATVSGDCSGGLFRKRDASVLPARYNTEDASHRFRGRNWRIISSDLWDKGLLSSHLYGRGWVFQERMLSPRLLHFGQGQIFWDCATNSACETFPGGIPLALGAKAGTDRNWRRLLQSADGTMRSSIKTSEGSPERFWESAVLAYTSCALTKHDDKDSAIWGIAKLIRDMRGEEYAYGLWATGLGKQLAWRVASQPAVKRLNTNQAPFPSWSWMCLDVPIQVEPRFEDATRFYAVTDHDGGAVAFQFETMLFGKADTEDDSGPHWAPGIKTKQLSDVKMDDVKTRQEPKISPNPNIPNSDECTKLRSPEIEVRGHICTGTLRYHSDEKRWLIGIDGVGAHAVVEAYPDFRCNKDEAPCRFLVLGASRIAQDRYGQEFYDPEEIEQDEYEIKMEYSGVGLLVQWENEKEKRLERAGAVKFRQFNRYDWTAFRRACGEVEEALQFELDAVEGQCVRLV